MPGARNPHPASYVCAWIRSYRFFDRDLDVQRVSGLDDPGRGCLTGPAPRLLRQQQPHVNVKPPPEQDQTAPQKRRLPLARGT